MCFHYNLWSHYFIKACILPQTLRVCFLFRLAGTLFPRPWIQTTKRAASLICVEYYFGKRPGLKTRMTLMTAKFPTGWGVMDVLEGAVFVYLKQGSGRHTLVLQAPVPAYRVQVER